MPRNGNGLKAVEKVEPNDLYDSLPSEQQSIWDQIGSNGYTPYRGHDGNLWWARRTGTPDEGKDIGPAGALAELSTMVDEYIAANGKSETILTADVKGNRYLPGAEEVVDQELKDVAFEEFTDKQEWKEAGKKKKNSKAKLDALAASKKKLFYPDPSNSNDLIYNVGGLTIRMAKEYSVTVKTEETVEEKEAVAA